MLEIGYNNIFHAGNDSHYGVLKVLEMYDHEYNWVLLHRVSSSFATKILYNKSYIYSPSKLSQFANGNNLYKVDLIIIESNTDILSSIRKYIKLPIIIITKDISKFDLNKYDFKYEFVYKSPPFRYFSRKSYGLEDPRYFIKI